MRDTVVKFARDRIPVLFVAPEAGFDGGGEVFVGGFGLRKKGLEAGKMGGVSGEGVGSFFCGCQRRE